MDLGAGRWIGLGGGKGKEKNCWRMVQTMCQTWPN